MAQELREEVLTLNAAHVVEADRLPVYQIHSLVRCRPQLPVPPAEEMVKQLRVNVPVAMAKESLRKMRLLQSIFLQV